MSLLKRNHDKKREPGEGNATASSPNGKALQKPTDLPVRSWGGVFGRTVREFKADNLTDWAAALTYYSVLSIFPMLIAFVGVVGLVGQHPQTTNAILRIVNDLGPSSAVDTFRGPVQGVVSNKSGAGIALVVGLVGALWSGSGYIGAFTRASNTIYEVDEGRPFWKLRPLQLVVTLVMVLLLAVIGLAIVLTGPVADAVA